MLDVDDDDVVSIDTLRLAAWLILNQQHLLDRKLEPDGRVLYSFRRNPEIGDLIRDWEVKSPYEAALVRYSNIVSFEIRKAIRMRREAGVPLRLRSSDKG